MRKLPQLTLRDLFWLVALAAIAMPSEGSESDQRLWFDILSDAKTITILAAEPMENEVALRNKSFKGEEVTRIVTMASKVRRFHRLDEGDAATIVKPVVVQVEILTFDKRRVVADFHAGGVIVTYEGKHSVADFENVDDGVKLLRAFGAKWPDNKERQ